MLTTPWFQPPGNKCRLYTHSSPPRDCSTHGNPKAIMGWSVPRTTSGGETIGASTHLGHPTATLEARSRMMIATGGDNRNQELVLKL